MWKKSQNPRFPSSSSNTNFQEISINHSIFLSKRIDFAFRFMWTTRTALEKSPYRLNNTIMTMNSHTYTCFAAQFNCLNRLFTRQSSTFRIISLRNRSESSSTSALNFRRCLTIPQKITPGDLHKATKIDFRCRKNWSSGHEINPATYSRNFRWKLRRLWSHNVLLMEEIEGERKRKQK